MIHLRIVVPDYQAEHALDLLDATPSVCNLIHLPRAAKRPVGDVILCDVSRDDASVVIADLRELDIDIEGSIAIEEVDSQISLAATKAEKAGKLGGADPVVWEQLASKTNESVEASPAFLIFMVLACLIAGVGIYFDQPILIIGAMVVGPEFGPIAGICVALVSQRHALAKRSAMALLIGFPLGIVATYLATLALKGTGLIDATIDFDNHLLTRFISNPDFFSGYVAALAGIVGMLSLTSSKSSVLVGVLISVATIPAAANIGVAAAYTEWGEFGGAALQLAINLAAIFIAGLATLYVQRLIYVKRRRNHLSDDSRVAAGLPVGSSRRAKLDPKDEPDAV